MRRSVFSREFERNDVLESGDHVTTQTHDDGFHEIQLNGKQLVFLFMAVTVVSVVIFLCGVLVGRGVRTERTGLVADAALGLATTPELPRSQPAPVPAGSDPTAAAPPPSGEDLSYFNRLEKKTTAAEQLKLVVEKGTPPSSAATAAKPSSPPPVVQKIAKPDKPEKPVPTPEPARAVAAPPAASSSPAAESKPVATVSADAPSAEPAGQGFALQITALKEPAEADAIARRLSAKGYAAYVLKPAAGTPSVYRVRVGKFKTRREAEAIATKLHKEEQFTPWITR